MRRVAGRSVAPPERAVIANCEFVAAPWRRYVERVDVIFNGVSAAGRAGAATALTAAPTWRCIGRIAPEKGQLEFLKAAGIMQSLAIPTLVSRSTAQRFSPKPERKRMTAKSAPARPGFLSNSRDGPTTSTPPSRNIDILLVPSAPHEATTRVILEAYAAGVPVVAFASGGIPEIVEDGVTGYLTRSAGEMAAAAVELLRNPSKRAAMSVAARECWARRFTLERYRNDVLAALETAWQRAAPRNGPSQSVRHCASQHATVGCGSLPSAPNKRITL